MSEEKVEIDDVIGFGVSPHPLKSHDEEQFVYSLKLQLKPDVADNKIDEEADSFEPFTDGEIDENFGDTNIIAKIISSLEDDDDSMSLQPDKTYQNKDSPEIKDQIFEDIFSEYKSKVIKGESLQTTMNGTIAESVTIEDQESLIKNTEPFFENISLYAEISLDKSSFSPCLKNFSINLVRLPQTISRLYSMIPTNELNKFKRKRTNEDEPKDKPSKRMKMDKEIHTSRANSHKKIGKRLKAKADKKHRDQKIKETVKDNANGENPLKKDTTVKGSSKPTSEQKDHKKETKKEENFVTVKTKYEQNPLKKVTTVKDSSKTFSKDQKKEIVKAKKQATIITIKTKNEENPLKKDPPSKSTSEHKDQKKKEAKKEEKVITVKAKNKESSLSKNKESSLSKDAVKSNSKSEQNLEVKANRKSTSEEKDKKKVTVKTKNEEKDITVKLKNGENPFKKFVTKTSKKSSPEQKDSSKSPQKSNSSKQKGSHDVEHKSEDKPTKSKDVKPKVNGMNKKIVGDDFLLESESNPKTLRRNLTKIAYYDYDDSSCDDDDEEYDDEKSYQVVSDSSSAPRKSILSAQKKSEKSNKRVSFYNEIFIKRYVPDDEEDESS